MSMQIDVTTLPQNSTIHYCCSHILQESVPVIKYHKRMSRLICYQLQGFRQSVSYMTSLSKHKNRCLHQCFVDGRQQRMV